MPKWIKTGALLVNSLSEKLSWLEEPAHPSNPGGSGPTGFRKNVRNLSDHRLGLNALPQTEIRDALFEALRVTHELLGGGRELLGGRGV